MGNDTAPYAVIADDLTGAGDAGVQFAAVGLRTRTLVGTWTEEHLRGAEVVVIDTASRGFSGAQAYSTVHAAAVRLQEPGLRVVYKKIDSTLRGAVGVEIDALLDACDLALAVVCPAYPANGRTLSQGVLLVRGVPVGETAAAADPHAPVRESHVPTLLARQTRRSVHWLGRLGAAGLATELAALPRPRRARRLHSGVRRRGRRGLGGYRPGGTRIGQAGPAGGFGGDGAAVGCSAGSAPAAECAGAVRIAPSGGAQPGTLYATDRQRWRDNIDDSGAGAGSAGTIGDAGSRALSAAGGRGAALAGRTCGKRHRRDRRRHVACAFARPASAWSRLRPGSCAWDSRRAHCRRSLGGLADHQQGRWIWVADCAGGCSAVFEGKGHNLCLLTIGQS